LQEQPVRSGRRALPAYCLRNARIPFPQQSIPGVKSVWRPIMFSKGKGRSKIAFVLGPALAGVILLLAISTAPAGGKEHSWPWPSRPKIHGYDEKRPPTPPPASVTRPPLKYTISITVLPQRDTRAETDTASMVAHLPEDTLLWIDDYQTRQSGMLRHF